VPGTGSVASFSSTATPVGKLVIEAFSRTVVGWSIADHLRAEFVDALQMAIWRRRPPAGTVAHSDHGAQYTKTARPKAFWARKRTENRTFW
jgi:transposase InsO family protein